MYITNFFNKYVFNKYEWRKKLTGVYIAKKKDGSIFYRASITHLGKHISLGSFTSENAAHLCYKEAQIVLKTLSYTLNNYPATFSLSFAKYISLLNFRDHSLYFSAPIYVWPSYFSYFLSEDIECKFEIDDLFYYANKTIMQRKNHLFVSEFGMQTNIASRYGIKNYAVCGKDYIIKNNDPYDFRYHNIQIINTYHGVSMVKRSNKTVYQAKIHTNGYSVIGYYKTPIEAAIAYNKAIDILRKNGYKKNYVENYIEEISNKVYADIYTALTIRTNVLSTI